MPGLNHSPDIVHRPKRSEEEREPRDRADTLQGPGKVREDLLESKAKRERADAAHADALVQPWCHLGGMKW